MCGYNQTTAVAMSWCLLMLATHPDIQEKARQEILSVIPETDEPLTLKCIEQLKYCSWVVKETLRFVYLHV